MSLHIGDNFSYLGKKFLDARKSFNTLEEMNACNDVPKGFITICYENNKRYEYNGIAWVEYKVGGNVNVDDIVYYGTETPTNDDIIWFYPDSGYVDLLIENPLLTELFNTIKSMQSQIAQLQADVEYLKTHGGGGGGTVKPPDPEKPTPSNYSYLILEDGSKLLFEDGSGMLLEEQQAVAPSNYSYLILEDGSKLLFEDGSKMLLEEQDIIKDSSYLLLESREKLLFEDGSKMLLEA